MISILKEGGLEVSAMGWLQGLGHSILNGPGIAPVELVAEHAGKSLDVATAFFSIRGFDILKDGLDGLGSFRLLLGVEPPRFPSLARTATLPFKELPS